MDGPIRHRIAEVRRQQRVSIRTASRKLGLPVSEASRQEMPDYDMKLSDLLRWQKALDVPVADLLVEGEGQLSAPILERARMVKLMKTAATIQERTTGTATGRLVSMLIEQLVELMPEVEGVAPWPHSGRRTIDELGRTALCPFPDEAFRKAE